MNEPRITLLGSQHDLLVAYLDSHQNSHEMAAIILFRRIKDSAYELSESDKYIAVDVIPFELDWINSSSPNHIDFQLAPFRELFRRCEEENLVFGFVHNHPSGVEQFSDIDESNEKRLLSAISNRNGIQLSFISMLWANNKWFAHVRHAKNPDIAINVRHITVLTDRFELYGYRSTQSDDCEILARQEAAFGKPFIDKLQSLRIGIIGGGGTGSAIVTLLARSGIGEIILVDDDKLEESNLNRVRGSKRSDVGSDKAKMLKDYIDSLGLPVSINIILSKADEDIHAVDSLASCDLIFGCTDDQIGRELITVMSYVYAIPIIDIGLGGQIVEDKDGTAILGYHFGRVSTVFPEYGECLFCQGVIKDEWIQTQYALRENPDLSEEEKKERYLVGGGEEAPGVIPFTSGTSDFAVATLYDLVKPYRKYPPEIRKDSYRIDFVKMELASIKAAENLDCPYCKDKKFTLMKEDYRLNRPMLGKRDIYV